MVVVRNDDYWEDPAKLEAVVFRPITDANTRVAELMAGGIDLMVEVLSQNNAIIDKFIGDAIVARFDSGDPATDALDAVRGAWGMCRELERFNLDSFEEVQSRIGINSGEVILGNLGCHKHRLEYCF
mgnify:CR=1 FL=1